MMTELWAGQVLDPGRPKILFIGRANSSHTHAWIDLLDGEEFNVHLFAMPDSLPPDGWRVQTFISTAVTGQNSETRHFLYSGLRGRVFRLANKVAARLNQPRFDDPQRWLAEIIRRWQPDVIHTLGMFDDQGGWFYYQTREAFKLHGFGKWILQTRGGSDLALRRHDPHWIPVIQGMFNACDQIISDNTANIRYAQEMGIAPEKFASVVPVPGTGGVDIAELSHRTLPPSKRERLILWTKVYESQWSKALPVLEALRLVWEQIQPCELHLFATTPEVRAWILAMPEAIRRRCRIHERVPRNEILSLMKRARILLIPSLIDGVPNSLYEALATGAFPIVSPLDTIQSVVENETNVLFARNLYPEEIGAALIRAMRDDDLVDKAAQNNATLAFKIADRKTIQKRVVRYYASL